MSRIRRLLGNILLSIATIATTLLIIELIGQQVFTSGDVPRQFNERVRYVNPPNAEWTIRKKDYTTHIRTNSLGFRGPEMPENPKSHEMRILFLGDSFVEAKQVEEEERFVERTGKRLEKELRKPMLTRALAIGGSNPALQLLYYREIGQAFDPDIVVQVLFPENDLLPQEGPYTFRTESGRLVLEDIWVESPPPCPWKCNILRKSILIRSIYHSLRKRTNRTHSAADTLGDYYWYTGEGQSTLVRQNRWKVLRALISALRKEVEDDGGKLLVVLMPSVLEIQDTWREEYLKKQPYPREFWKIDRLLHTTEQALKREGIAVLNLRDVFVRVASNEDPLYYKSDPHLSVRGHEVATAAIYKTILALE